MSEPTERGASPPVCPGQAWELAAGKGDRVLIVLGQVFEHDRALWVPVFRLASTKPTCERLGNFAGARLLHVPGTRTLSMARRWRTGGMEVEPSRLHAAALEDAAEDGLPEVGRKLRAQALYLHALTEAGAIVAQSGLPFDPCPVCGWRADGSITPEAEPEEVPA